MVMGIAQAFIHGDYQSLNENTFKYSALNFCTLQTLGTIEFRGLSTYPDLSKISEWGNMIINIRDYALSKRSAQEIIHDFSVLGPKNFIIRVLKDEAKYVLPTTINETQCYEDMRLAQDVAHYKYL
jgi:hypothetical protein